MRDASIDRWLLYLGGAVIAVVVYCLIACQTDKTLETDVAERRTKTQESSFEIQTPITKNTTEQKERQKTPDELYEEQHNIRTSDSSNETSWSFDGDEVVPPELLELEKNANNVRNKQLEQDSNIVPKGLQELEKKAKEARPGLIKQDTNIVPKELQRLERNKVGTYVQEFEPSDVLSEELHLQEEQSLTQSDDVIYIDENIN